MVEMRVDATRHESIRWLKETVHLDSYAYTTHKRDAAHRMEVSARLPPDAREDAIVIGGGGAALGRGAFLTSSCPTKDLDGWFVATKGHAGQVETHVLEAYFLALRIDGMRRPDLVRLVQVFEAHSAPAEQHRIMLLALEYNLQIALGDAGFALPYWDWVADASKASPLWSDAPDYLGTGRGGGLHYDPNLAGPGQYAVTLYEDPDDPDRKLTQIPPRAVLRELGADDLAISTEVADAAKETEYDAPRYNDTSSGFRSSLEVNVHNPVHLWVGGARGDMGPVSSPNDPVFFLHHCNVDRIWEAWMQTNTRTYQPNMSASLRDHLGFRIDDVLPLAPGDIPIRATLDMTEVFRYDSFVNTGTKAGQQF